MLMAVRCRELFGNILIVVSVTQWLVEGRKLETGRTEEKEKKKTLWINKEDNMSDSINKKPEGANIALMCRFGCLVFFCIIFAHKFSPA